MLSHTPQLYLSGRSGWVWKDIREIFEPLHWKVEVKIKWRWREVWDMTWRMVSPNERAAKYVPTSNDTSDALQSNDVMLWWCDVVMGDILKGRLTWHRWLVVVCMCTINRLTFWIDTTQHSTARWMVARTHACTHARTNLVWSLFYLWFMYMDKSYDWRWI